MYNLGGFRVPSKIQLKMLIFKIIISCENYATDTPDMIAMQNRTQNKINAV